MAKRLKYKYHVNGDLPHFANMYIIVFGSNERGAHGKGMARVAKEMYGAEYGVPLGLTGRSYAIPTKDRFIRTLSIAEIQKYVAQFKEFTHNRPDLKFWVTGIGCGLAGYKPYEIAPLFIGCNTNCDFPHNWKPYLK